MAAVIFGGMEIALFARISQQILVATFALLVFMAALPSQADAAQCYPLGPAVVTLRGVVITDVGGSFFLILDKPICVRGEGDGGLIEANGVSKIHLTWKQTVSLAQMRDSVGKQVDLTGDLFDAITAHHKTPILMMIHQVQRVSSP